MSLLPIISFLLYTGLVGVYAFMKTRSTNLESADGYYLGGRSLTGVFIAGSIILSNLSTEQIVGQNGTSFGSTMAVMAFEETAPIALIALALIFLPCYLKSGITTIPDFLEERYDRKTRQMISILFLLGYAATYLPTVLYSGALVLDQIFNISGMLGVSQMTAVAITAVFIGIIGLGYVVFGGMKAIAVSDTLNAVGLLAGGLLIPILALIALGHGSFTGGIHNLITMHPEKLNGIGGSASAVPWPTIFFGLLFNNLFYFCTNQAIVQRTLGGKNLIESQKGALFAATFKLIGPFFLVLPGVIAFSLLGNSVLKNDLAYPALVISVLPKPLAGLFAAILFGAIMSAFNGAVNSSVTLFTMDLYKPSINPKATDKQVVWVGKMLALAIVIISVIVAPFVSKAPSGLYLFLQQMFGFYNIPIIAIVIIAFCTKRVSATATRVATIIHVIIYALYIIFFSKVNFLYVLSVLFFVNVAVMLIVGKIKPRETDYVQVDSKQVDLTPWKYRKVYSVFLIIAMLCIYVLFSKIGIAR